MVAFHKEFRVSATIAGESMFRNKIPETWKPGCPCNGMKTLLSDPDYELHLGCTAKPGIQKTLDCWIAAVIFGTCGDEPGTISAAVERYER